MGGWWRAVSGKRVGGGVPSGARGGEQERDGETLEGGGNGAKFKNENKIGKFFHIHTEFWLKKKLK